MKKISETHKGRPWAIIIEREDIVQGPPPSDPYYFSDYPYELLSAINKADNLWIGGPKEQYEKDKAAGKIDYSKEYIVVYTFNGTTEYQESFFEEFDKAMEFYIDFYDKVKEPVIMNNYLRYNELINVYKDASPYDKAKLLQIGTLPIELAILIITGESVPEHIQAKLPNRNQMVDTIYASYNSIHCAYTLSKNLKKYLDDLDKGGVAVIPLDGKLDVKELMGDLDEAEIRVTKTQEKYIIRKVEQ